MRLNRMQRTAVCILLAAATGCGGNASRSKPSAATTTHPKPETSRYVATGFQPDPARGVVLAILPVPMTGDLATRIDLGFDRVFSDTPGFQLRYPSGQLRSRMNGDHRLVLMLNAITKFEAESKPGTAPGLDTFMSSHEIAHLREVLLTSDVLLVPSAFEYDDASKSTSGHFNAHMYDLRTGRLLFRDVFQHTLPSGPDARIAVAMELILTANSRIATDLLPKSH